MNKALFIIQTIIIVVLLVIVGTMALQLKEYERAYGVLKNQPSLMNQIASSSSTIMKQAAAPAEQVPDFSKVTNSASNPPDVEAAIGVAAQNGTTGYRLTKDNKQLVYLTPEHMVLMDVASKEEKEIVSFKTWDRKLAGEGKECVPGSRFVKPIFTDNESAIFFGGPAKGQDGLYMYIMGQPQAKLVSLVDDCITDIAVSPRGLWVAYQTSKTLGTLTEGYVTNLYVVQADGTKSQLLAKDGKMPKDSLAEGGGVDFGPGEIVWPSEDAFFMKGYNAGTPTGIWKYDALKNSIKLVTNLKGGP